MDVFDIACESEIQSYIYQTVMFAWLLTDLIAQEKTCGQIVGKVPDCKG